MVFDDTPHHYAMMPDDLQAWLRANPNASEAEVSAAYKRSARAARARVLAVIESWKQPVKRELCTSGRYAGLMLPVSR